MPERTTKESIDQTLFDSKCVEGEAHSNYNRQRPAEEKELQLGSRVKQAPMSWLCSTVAWKLGLWASSLLSHNIKLCNDILYTGIYLNTLLQMVSQSWAVLILTKVSRNWHLIFDFPSLWQCEPNYTNLQKPGYRTAGDLLVQSWNNESKQCKGWRVCERPANYVRSGKGNALFTG